MQASYIQQMMFQLGEGCFNIDKTIECKVQRLVYTVTGIFREEGQIANYSRPSLQRTRQSTWSL